MNHHALLTAKEESLLMARAKAGDADARAELVEKNQRLVYSIANRYFHRGAGGDQELDDLVQWGNVGLLYAIDKFDPARGLRLSTSAVYWIRAYITRYGSIRGHALGLTYRDCLSFGPLRRARADLTQRLQREPTVEEIAGALGKDSRTVASLLPLLDSQVSLDAPHAAHGDDDINLYEILPDNEAAPDENAERSAVLQEIAKAVLALGDQQREVITRRYLTNPPDTAAEIASDMGISGARVQQIERAAIQRLRAMFDLNSPCQHRLF